MKKFIYIIALALVFSFVTSCGSKTTKVEIVSAPAVEVVDSTIVDTLLIDSIVVDSVVAE